MFDLKKKGIGIFGGSFDPPHLGHVKICKVCLKELKLKKIFWVVTKKNPFKKKTLFPLHKRINMSKKALKNSKKIKVLYLEREVKSSRTIDIIKYFIVKKNYTNTYLILGSDNLLNFHKWTSWKKVVKLTKLVVFSGQGYDKKGKKSKIVKYLNKKNIIFIKNKPINISSTEIRKKAKII